MSQSGGHFTQRCDPADLGQTLAGDFCFYIRLVLVGDIRTPMRSDLMAAETASITSSRNR